MTAKELLERCLDELDSDIHSDPVTLELVHGIRAYLAQDGMIVNERVVSSGNGITVTAVSVADHVREALSTGEAKLPADCQFMKRCTDSFGGVCPGCK